jgi:2-polyprenyl-6-hydroxyphenyl methylase/3-demethylubiquinone-9 3-methyltransferase
MNKPNVNNDIYEQLGDRWFCADNDPVALLRAQAKILGPWIVNQSLRGTLGDRSLLEIGCGGGLIARQVLDAAKSLDKVNLTYSGIDLSQDALRTAAKYCPEGKFTTGNAENLPFADHSFDVVVALDLLEHVQNPSQVISEAARVLRPGGQFFFHTFNRNPLAYLLVIKMVEWFVPNTPKDMHVLHLFLKPSEIKCWLEQSGFALQSLLGVEPNLFRWSNLKGIFARQVPKDFSFRFTRSTLISYAGIAQKRSS